MAVVMVKCPKCGNMCDFNEGSLFGFCNKCGSRLERDINNDVKVYDREQESDEAVLFAMDRFDTCTKMVVPTRSTHDIESLNYEIERMMDEFMTFNEVLKEIYSETENMDDARKHRVSELCFEMADKIFLQFESFLKEYDDFGMYDEMKSVRDAFSKLAQGYAQEFASKQRKAIEEYWADKPEEYEALKKALAKAIDERSKVLFFNLEQKWVLDSEIERLQNEINRVR